MEAEPSKPAGADPLDAIVTLELSESDRWFAAAMLSGMRWGGGERVVLSFGTIWDVLRLDEIQINAAPAQLSSAVDAFELTRGCAETLMRVICGAGGESLPGKFGPPLARLAKRLRVMLDVQAARALTLGGGTL